MPDLQLRVQLEYREPHRGRPLDCAEDFRNKAAEGTVRWEKVRNDALGMLQYDAWRAWRDRKIDELIRFRETATLEGHRPVRPLAIQRHHRRAHLLHDNARRRRLRTKRSITISQRPRHHVAGRLFVSITAELPSVEDAQSFCATRPDLGPGNGSLSPKIITALRLLDCLLR